MTWQTSLGRMGSAAPYTHLSAPHLTAAAGISPDARRGRPGLGQRRVRRDEDEPHAAWHERDRLAVGGAQRRPVRSRWSAPGAVDATTTTEHDGPAVPDGVRVLRRVAEHVAVGRVLGDA